MSECLLMHVQLWELPRDSVTNRLCHYSLIFFFTDAWPKMFLLMHHENYIKTASQTDHVNTAQTSLMIHVQLWELPKDSITDYVITAWMYNYENYPKTASQAMSLLPECLYWCMYDYDNYLKTASDYVITAWMSLLMHIPLWELTNRTSQRD